METVINLAYLVAAALFILGIKRLNSPATARRGNRLAAVGMLIAVVATLLAEQILAPWMIVGGVALGAAVGGVIALRVPMTSMPEMVAALNGFGGGASVLVAWGEVQRYVEAQRMGFAGIAFVERALDPLTATFVLAVGLSVLIGAVTVSGSFVAFGKLSGNPVAFPGMRVLTVLLALAALVTIAFPLVLLLDSRYDAGPIAVAVPILVGIALVLGILLVIPIGGADMPVVVSLLNSYSGLAAAATGFVLGNYALIVSGALVGASGIILTRIMCDAMNRSLVSVLLGGFGGDAVSGPAGSALAGQTIRSTTPDDAAVLLGYAERVVFVPGYGLAVAQAQHQLREVAELLEGRGVDVRYAIHPVAGRMPGHMSVLLSETGTDYDRLITEVDEANAALARADVAVVIGANDIVNPDAVDSPGSPLYGMPIVDVRKAKTAIVMKRGLGVGYAGVENPLFAHSGTQMLFGDAKQTLEGLVGEVKQL